MPAETVTRRWTVATWLIAGIGDDLVPVMNALRSVGADAVAMQSVRESDASAIAEALEYQHAWELSHYPKTPLFRSGGVGLCVLSPHEVDGSRWAPITGQRSTWSRRRRIAQAANVRRADHSEYQLLHRVGPSETPAGTANTIVITPEQVGVDAALAVQLPEAARLVTAQVERPIATVAPLQATTFEMDWVSGDFPV